MANQTVLEEIVVRLTGENSSLVKACTESTAAIRTMTNRMYTALSRAERFAGTLIKGLGSFGLASSLRGMFQQFADLEQGQIRLNAAIRGGGHDAEALVARYTRVAESLSAVTLNTKGSVLGLFQQAEAAQLSGDKAEQAVRYAVALAGATRQSADAMMRTAIQLVKGHPEFAKRILNLREMANGTELVDAIMRKMNTGMEIATAEFNSANGRMERLGRGFKSLGQDIGRMIAKVLLPVVGMLQQLVDGFKKLDPEIKKQIALWLGLAVAWLGMGPVTQVIKDLLTPTIHMLKFIAIEIPLMIARSIVWLAWKTVLGLAAIAVFSLAGLVWLLSGAEGAAALGVGIMSGAMAVWKTIIWLVNAGLVVTLGLLTGVIIIVPVMAAILGTAFLVVWNAVSAVVTALRAIPSLAGPMGVITRVLGEWWAMLKEIFSVAQSDMPRAWEMMKAGFALAVQQMKDVFPPLWTFISDGFALIWDSTANLFKAKMLNTIRDVMNVARMALPGVLAVIGAPPPAINEGAITAQLTRRLGILAASFGVQESDETQRLRAVYQALVPIPGAANNAMGPLERIQAVMKKTADHAQRFDAALSGSVEAIARMAEYQDRIRFDQQQAAQQSFSPAAALAGGSMSGMAGGAGTAPVVNVLLQILGQLQQSPVIQLKAAGL